MVPSSWPLDEFVEGRVRFALRALVGGRFGVEALVPEGEYDGCTQLEKLGGESLEGFDGRPLRGAGAPSGLVDEVTDVVAERVDEVTTLGELALQRTSGHACLFGDLRHGGLVVGGEDLHRGLKNHPACASTCPRLGDFLLNALHHVPTLQRSASGRL